MKSHSAKVGKSTADSNNDGVGTYSAMKGQTIVVPYGKDGSSLKGSMEHERGKEMKNTGLSKSMKA